MVFIKELFQRVDFWGKSADNKNPNITLHAKSVSLKCDSKTAINHHFSVIVTVCRGPWCSAFRLPWLDLPVSDYEIVKINKLFNKII